MMERVADLLTIAQLVVSVQGSLALRPLDPQTCDHSQSTCIFLSQRKCLYM